MNVFLNGRFVPEEEAVISVFDRGFLYGDGLFETMRVSNGKLFRWRQHWERFERGAAFLQIRLAYSESQLCEFADTLIAQSNLSESLLRITVSRGIGPRGYSPKGADNSTTIISVHPAPAANAEQPAQWQLVTAEPRLPAAEPISHFKTCNKLAQVLARSEADSRGAHEALLLNTDGHVVEGSSSNLFWIERGEIHTPPLASGILAGVTRAVVAELCARLELPWREGNLKPEQLPQMEAVFLSLSSLGIAEAVTLDGKKLRQSPLVKKLSIAYWKTVREETDSR